jgi:protein-tyrosine phosphatase
VLGDARLDGARLDVIDLHTHLLPGLDDGPATVEEAVAMARATLDAGVTEVVATPHVSVRYPNDSEQIRTALATLRTALEDAGVPLRVHAGAEIDFDTVLTLPPEQLEALRMGEGPFVMVESPLGTAASDAALLVHALRERGHRVLLAHPERSPMFQRDPAQLDRLVADGVLTSLTADAFTGRFGRVTQRFATTLLRRGLVHNIVSDMHDVVGRPPGITPPPLPSGDDPERHTRRVAWLTQTVPAAILDGTPVPPGPAAPPERSEGRRSLLRRLVRAGA